MPGEKVKSGNASNKRVHHFGAGPGPLPAEVLERLREAPGIFADSGVSIFEVSHRSKQYAQMQERIEGRLRELLGIPKDYAVLFLTGGASSQFSMVPLNLLGEGRHASYVDTGKWSQKAIAEAERFGSIEVAASGNQSEYRAIPSLPMETLSPNTAYLHITTNNTIYGTSFGERIPNTGEIPLVGDMSSEILSRPIDVSAFGLIYAGAQKNMGIAGLTIVIIRRELIGKALPQTPAMFNYANHERADSRYNTPPVLPIYVTGLVLDWIVEQGGLPEMERRNTEKARMLYDALDRSPVFELFADSGSRSLTNVTFQCVRPEVEPAFSREAAREGLAFLKGHRAVGGLRASIYNAVSIKSVAVLSEFIENFSKRHG